MKKLSLLAASMGLAISFTASAVEFGSYTSHIEMKRKL